jgi:hypothetical protein
MNVLAIPLMAIVLLASGKPSTSMASASSPKFAPTPGWQLAQTLFAPDEGCEGVPPGEMVNCTN